MAPHDLHPSRLTAVQTADAREAPPDEHLPRAADPTDPARGAQVARDDRAHVFHSWSAQALINPMPIAGGVGRYFWDFDGQALPRLLQPAGQRQHRLPAPASSSRRSRSRRPGSAPSRRASPTTPAPRRRGSSPASRPATLNRVFFTNGGAEANENAMRMARLHTGRHKVLTAYRSYHGATAGADHRHRRPAALAERARHERASCTSGGRTPTARPFHATTEAEECERALQHLRDTIMVEGPSTDRGDHARDRGGHQRHPRAAGRLPRRRPRDLRRARHPLDRRRGDGRLRPVRRVVRRRPLGRRPRPDLLRQGRQLRLRAARRRGHLRRDRRDVRRPRLPRWAHLLGPPAGLRVGGRVDPDLPGGGHPRERAQGRATPSSRRGWPRSPRSTRASARCAGSASSGRSSWCATATTREPLVPYNAGGAAAGADERVRRGLQGARGCGRSSTSTAPTSCRRARRPPTRWPRASTILDRALEVADRFTA